MTSPNPNADRTEVCPKCHGGGKETSLGGVMHECLNCSGWGYVRPQLNVRDHAEDCPRCGEDCPALT